MVNMVNKNVSPTGFIKPTNYSGCQKSEQYSMIYYLCLLYVFCLNHILFAELSVCSSASPIIYTTAVLVTIRINIF